ncbi:MAG: hypothetical protein ABIS29_00595 [Vicinamibacterales bacterium]
MRGPLSEPDASGFRSVPVRVKGQLRESGEPFAALASLGLGCAQFELTSVDLSCREMDLAAIAASRRA